MSYVPDLSSPLVDTSDKVSLINKMKGINPKGFETLSQFSGLSLIFACYSSYIVYYDINNYKTPVTDKKIEIGQYIINLLFVMISVYLLVSTNIKFNISTCKYTGKDVAGKICAPFSLSISYLLLFFTIVYLYNAVVTLAVYHKLVKDVVLIKKLKIASISLNILVIVLSLNYLREFISN